jgi:aminoglycoside 2''-phosphotransferase
MGTLTAEQAAELVRARAGPPVSEITELGRGTDSVAFRVDREWVLRFPMVANARASLRRELALLDRLAARLPVPVPCFEQVLVDGEVLLGVGYRILDGCPLDSEWFTALPAGGQQRALTELAGFLDALHAFPLEAARAAGVIETLHNGGYHRGQRGLPARLTQLLTPAEVARLDAIVAAYERDHQPVAALVHADLKPAHVLCDPASGRLTGVLDWGDASIGDPDFDLALMALFFGASFQARLLEHLRGRDPAAIAAKTLN